MRPRGISPFGPLQLLASFLLAFLPFSAKAQNFVPIDFPGSPQTAPQGINDKGQVVGFYGAGNGFLGFIFTQGNFQTIEVPGSFPFSTMPSGLNNLGQVVGLYNSQPDFAQHGFLMTGSIFIAVDCPEATGTFANGINDLGQIVGFCALPPPCTTCSPIIHAFIESGGIFSFFDFPGARVTVPTGINKVGQIVGYYVNLGNAVEHGFLLSNGNFTQINFPGGNTHPTGINDAGQIVGIFSKDPGRSPGDHGFLVTGGNFSEFDLPGAELTQAFGINNGGQVTGLYVDESNIEHGFISNPIALLDPIPDLLDGPGITNNGNLLGAGGRAVRGVAADGVTQIVVRIPVDNCGDQSTLTLLNVDDPPVQSSSPEEDGVLGHPGDSTPSQSSLTVTAASTNAGSFAFAVYRAPEDFPRSGGQDINAASRSVSIQIQSSGGCTTTMPVAILRPPVILVHGIWDTSQAWHNFSPLVNSGVADKRFYVGRVNYTTPLGNSISFTSPAYPLLFVLNSRANSLGFYFNAKQVVSDVQRQIKAFQRGQNPAGIPVAGVQADLVAHSMGGDIVRTLPLLPTFLSSDTFGQGNIHKVITIDTPHLGTPLATQLLSDNNTCVRDLLAALGNIAFDSVTLSGKTVSGAVGDLQGDGSGIFMSQALNNIRFNRSHPLPTALIAGVIGSANLDGLNTSPAALSIFSFCGQTLLDPLALNLNPVGWPSVFGQPSDAIVPLSSELNNLTANPGSEFFGVVHSQGTEDLGFEAPSVLDPGAVPQQVINLLNTPVGQPVFVRLP